MIISNINLCVRARQNEAKNVNPFKERQHEREAEVEEKVAKTANKTRPKPVVRLSAKYSEQAVAAHHKPVLFKCHQTGMRAKSVRRRGNGAPQCIPATAASISPPTSATASVGAGRRTMRRRECFVALRADVGRARWNSSDPDRDRRLGRAAFFVPLSAGESIAQSIRTTPAPLPLPR